MRYSPSCNCCGGGGGGCCSGTIPNHMTIQLGFTGGTNFQPNNDWACQYACIDLQGTWNLIHEAGNGCQWCADAEIEKVPATCPDGVYETWPVSFHLRYDPAVGANGTLYLTITAATCSTGTGLGVEVLLYAEGSPSSLVCSEWAEEQALTILSGTCFADGDFATVSSL